RRRLRVVLLMENGEFEASFLFCDARDARLFKESRDETVCRGLLVLRKIGEGEGRHGCHVPCPSFRVSLYACREKCGGEGAEQTLGDRVETAFDALTKHADDLHLGIGALRERPFEESIHVFAGGPLNRWVLEVLNGGQGRRGAMAPCFGEER